MSKEYTVIEGEEMEEAKVKKEGFFERLGARIAKFKPADAAKLGVATLLGLAGGAVLGSRLSKPQSVEEPLDVPYTVESPEVQDLVGNDSFEE